MAVFDDVILVWDSKEYKIPASRMLGAIAQIEEVITFQELCIAREKNKISLSRLSEAYGGVLRYAGVKATDEEVYAGMFASGAGQLALVTALTTILMMMVPKDLRSGGGESKQGKQKAVAKSSKRSTRSRSEKAGGSTQSNSGA
jgi:hypothetical protein